jgi:hypothetical protein
MWHSAFVQTADPNKQSVAHPPPHFCASAAPAPTTRYLLPPPPRDLRTRCDEFVRSNLDHMLTWRALKSRADCLEGEAAALGAANDELALRVAGTQVDGAAGDVMT